MAEVVPVSGNTAKDTQTHKDRKVNMAQAVLLSGRTVKVIQ